MKYGLWPEINHHRNLDGIYTDVLGVAYGKKSLEEILFKMLLRKKSIIGLFSLSHEQNKARFNYAMARKQRRMPI